MIGLQVKPEARQRARPLTNLSPAQETAYALLTSAVAASHLVLLEGEAGAGKTTMLARLVAEMGGRRLTCRDLYASNANAPHAALDGALFRLVEAALDRHDVVVVEDFDALGNIVDSFVGNPRGYYWQTGFGSLLDRARNQGKVLVFSAVSFISPVSAAKFALPLLSHRGVQVTIPSSSIEDYRFHIEAALGDELAGRLDVRKIFEHAPKLNIYQLRTLAAFVDIGKRTSDDFIREKLDQQILSTNLNTNEVANITFADLKGFEDIARQLAIYVINPLKGDARFSNLDVRPKRGVLLYGPPGTGKTSVGKALARQMEGKFFLIDGAVSTEQAAYFYTQVDWIFKAAKRAAPSVVFIDDADVLFQTDRATGFGRFLLTMLDGMESETAGKVAVILTAMNPQHLPQALLRSGRVELWLETKPPSREVRAEMVAALLAKAPAPFKAYDPDHAATLSDGFNAADMRRLVMDVKTLYGRDLLADRTPAPIDSYFERAVTDIHKARDLLAIANTRQLERQI
jgi:ATP-dependent 26S proteasome regulatory subunit